MVLAEAFVIILSGVGGYVHTKSESFTETEIWTSMIIKSRKYLFNLSCNNGHVDSFRKTDNWNTGNREKLFKNVSNDGNDISNSKTGQLDVQNQFNPSTANETFFV